MLNALNYNMVEQKLCMSDQSLKEESSIYKYDLLNYGREHVHVHFSEILLHIALLIQMCHFCGK